MSGLRQPPQCIWKVLKQSPFSFPHGGLLHDLTHHGKLQEQGGEQAK